MHSKYEKLHTYSNRKRALVPDSWVNIIMYLDCIYIVITRWNRIYIHDRRTNGNGHKLQLPLASFKCDGRKRALRQIQSCSTKSSEACSESSSRRYPRPGTSNAIKVPENANIDIDFAMRVGNYWARRNYYYFSYIWLGILRCCRNILLAMQCVQSMLYLDVLRLQELLLNLRWTVVGCVWSSSE